MAQPIQKKAGLDKKKIVLHDPVVYTRVKFENHGHNVIDKKGGYNTETLYARSDYHIANMIATYDYSLSVVLASWS